MKIVGQSFVDPSERFFHGMYVSAAGNPFYTSPPADGIVPLAISPYLMSALLAIVIAAILISSYMYLNKRIKPITTPSPIN